MPTARLPLRSSSRRGCLEGIPPRLASHDDDGFLLNVPGNVAAMLPAARAPAPGAPGATQSQPTLRRGFRTGLPRPAGPPPCTRAAHPRTRRRPGQGRAILSRFLFRGPSMPLAKNKPLRAHRPCASGNNRPPSVLRFPPLPRLRAGAVFAPRGTPKGRADDLRRS